MSKLLLITTLALLTATAIAETCDAPRYKWGSECKADNKFAGSPGSWVEYNLESVSPSAKVYCHAKGLKRYVESHKCIRMFWPLGQVKGDSFRVVWDETDDFPTLECFSFGVRAEVTWSYSTGVGEISCVGQEIAGLPENKVGNDEQR